MPIQSQIVMGTLVTIHVVRDEPGVNTAIELAFGWFHEIEDHCTRFDQRSELMQLSTQPGLAVPASAILYEAVHFALTLAEETGGAFDPTVGHRMAARGFNREYRTGKIVRTPLEPDDDVSHRDVQLDPAQRAITLLRPLTLDLGAVAKGLAVDTAARELEPFGDFAIDAGGDLYLGGSNPHGEPWCVWIRHPRRENELIDSLYISNQAVCTSGDYQQRVPVEPAASNGSNILDPRRGTPAQHVASATVIAPGAMLADALATAAFVLGPEEGLQLLNRMGVEGMIVTPDLQRFETGGLRRAA